MKERINGPLWIFGFSLIALAWPFVHNLAEQTRDDRAVEDRQIERIIKFCLDPKHSNSKLCIVKDPKSTDEIEQSIKNPDETQAKEAEKAPAKSGSTKVVETRTNTLHTDNTHSTTSTTRDSNGGGSSPTPEQPAYKLPSVPDVPKIDVPQPDVPDIPDVPDVPVVASQPTLASE